MHDSFLIKALKLAETRLGFTHPNPAVGAIVVKDGQVIAEGCHHQAGHAHAEVEALKTVSNEDAKKSTLYVTLEPCGHHGKTPPCTDLILSKKISKVVYAHRDPNPKVSGLGAKTLRSQGVDVTEVSVAEIENFYRSYDHWTRTGRPFVIAKLALSLDGKIAGPAGKTLKLTSAQADEWTHRQRLKANALLTTSKTVLSDNPRFNVRLGHESIKKPLYVLDSKGVIPTDSKIFSETGPVEILKIPRSDASLRMIMDRIGQDGIHELLVESGSELFSSLSVQGLLSKAFFLVAPIWVGKSGQPAFAHPDLLKLACQRSWSVLGIDALCEVNFSMV